MESQLGFSGNVSDISQIDGRDIERLCAEKGMRMTDQRRVIARVLADALDHPDVEELYRRAAAIDPKISLSTVYRTVKLFEDAEIIERHDFRDGRSRYEPISEDHHDHLIDLRTGQVIEFHLEEIEALQERVAKELGYRLVDHRLELYAVPIDQGADKRRAAPSSNIPADHQDPAPFEDKDPHRDWDPYGDRDQD